VPLVLAVKTQANHLQGLLLFGMDVRCELRLLLMQRFEVFPLGLTI
jgi:hypothetical protein